MKFAHMADCHIGGWREPRMQELAVRSFIKAVDISIEEDVEFILISGDLFNTALPGIDMLKTVAGELRRIKDRGIRTYIVPGSHDFSPSGKTMIDVLDTARLVRNVVRGSVADGKLRLEFTQDKSGAKIAGMLGKKGMLEKSYYEDLDTTHLEQEEGFKIFMFHTALSELKPKELEKMESSPLSLLPKGFDYYAGGHVHIRLDADEKGYGKIVYPGPTFPNSFSELEKLDSGSMILYEDGQISKRLIELHPVQKIALDCKGRAAEAVSRELMETTAEKDAIVTMRLSGRLGTGKPSDIDFRQAYDKLYEQGAYIVLKNTTALSSEEFEEVKITEDSVQDIEDSLIKEHLGQVKIENEEELTQKLMAALDTDKKEGETLSSFEKRLISDTDRLF